MTTKVEILNVDFISSRKQFYLDANLTVDDISKALPGVEDKSESGDREVTHHWEFTVNGVECAIWDYEGSRWSAYGTREAFALVGLSVY